MILRRGSRPVRRLLFVFVMTTLLGCPPGGPVEPSILLGSGEVEFELVEDGQVLQVIQGPQNGFHVLGSLLVQGLQTGDPNDLSNPFNPTTSFDVFHEGDSVILIEPFTQGLDEAPAVDAPWSHQLVGRFVALDIAADDVLDGEVVTISARVDDVNGLSAVDEVTVELEPHPFNQ